MSDVPMPKLSDSMEQGTILSWLKAAGESVALGDELLEIETDKSTVTYTAEFEGVLEILAEEGTTIAVGAPIARIGAATAAAASDSATPDAAMPQPDAPAPTAPAPATAALHPAAANGNGQRPTGVTPLARRAAAVHGVLLEGIQGTGPLGRITRADVMSHANLDVSDAPSLPALRPAPPGTPVASERGPVTAPAAVPDGARRVEPTRLQQLIARRMTEAKTTIPHFQVQAEVAMDEAIALRAKLKALAVAGDPVPSYNDLIVKAAAVALREHPRANGSYLDGGFVLHEQVNVGIAVAADDALIVPSVFAADGKSLGQIARETRMLAARVRSGEISPRELEGGTFTVSNLGMFGMTAITPVINPPQAAILGVGAMREHLARVDGEIVERTMLTLTLSCDHRILYGADAAQFLARIRELLEAPLKLAL